MRPRFVIIGIVGLAVLAVGAWFGPLRPQQTLLTPVAPTGVARYLPGGPLPAQALAVCQQVVSGAPDQQRAALVPDLDRQLPPGPLFPPGATVSMENTSWHQDDQYENAFGTVHRPGKPDQRIEFGFVRQASGQWLVIFATLQ